MDPSLVRSVRGDDRFARIVALAADAIVCVDKMQCITLFNNGAERTFGYAREEVMGKPLDILIPARFRRVHGRHVAQFAHGPASAGHMGERQAIYALRKNAEEFPAEATISKIDVGDENVLTVVLRDITPQKLVESQLEGRVAQRTSAREAEVRRRKLWVKVLIRRPDRPKLSGNPLFDLFKRRLGQVGWNLSADLCPQLFRHGRPQIAKRAGRRGDNQIFEPRQIAWRHQPG
jgi:PAS domain S-box-containing protein